MPQDEYSLEDVRAEAMQKLPGFKIKLKGNRKLTVPSPVVWTDEQLALLGQDPTACAKSVLGDRYEEFTQAGGNGVLFQRMVIDHNMETALATVARDAGESEAS